VGYSVRADDLFWKTLEDLDDDDVWDEAAEVCFTLVEEGPDLPDIWPEPWSVGPVVLPGPAVDLPSGAGFIVYFTPELLRHEYIYVAGLVMYDWYFDERA
jgi:hypothetical protein